MLEPFAGSDLFVGIEAEDCGVSEGPHLAAVESRAERFAGVFNYEKIMTEGDREDFVERGGTAEGVHDDDCASARSDGFFDEGRIEIERQGIDIDEDGQGALVTKNVGDGDECERGDEYFIAFGDAQRADADVEGAGAGIHGDGVRSANAAREGL